MERLKFRGQGPERTAAIQRFKALIKGATTSLTISQFWWTNMDLVRAVVKCSQRGVAVRVMMDGHSDNRPVRKLLREHNIPIVIVPRMHKTCAVIDNRTLIMGSMNWDLGGLLLNIESVYAIHDGSPIKQELANFDRSWIESIAGVVR